MPSGATDQVVAFYSGEPDSAGRRLDELQGWSDERLEVVHDYIQWMFPTRQPSGVNPFAPQVTDATVRAFASNDTLRARLRVSLDRVLAFYGLRRSGAPVPHVEIDPARFASRAINWLHAGNHNHLRLTRIIDSLAQLGLAEEAAAVKRCLVEDVAPMAGGRVTARTLDFWRHAGV